MPEEVVEIGPRSGVGRLETFESDLLESLRKVAQPNWKSTGKPALELLAAALRIAWDASQVTFLSGVNEKPAVLFSDVGTPIATTAQQRLTQIAAQRAAVMWVDATELSPAEIFSGFSFEATPLAGIVAPIVLHITFQMPLALHRDALLQGFAASQELLIQHGGAFFLDSLRTLQTDLAQCDAIVLESQSHRRRLCETMTVRLSCFVGRQYETLEQNQAIARTIQRLLDQHGLRLECPTCAEPATMRCIAAGNTRTGTFVFDHRINGRRTMHGGRKSVPRLVVVDRNNSPSSKPST